MNKLPPGCGFYAIGARRPRIMRFRITIALIVLWQILFAASGLLWL
jgi:hypothetical protein